MKTLRFKPLGPIAIGAMIVFIGALLKIVKLSFSDQLMAIGLVIELIGIIYFIYRYRLMKKKVKTFANNL
jgi:ABC-type Fe3+-siderophore transport system permease subunit